jgi:transposase
MAAGLRGPTGPRPGVADPRLDDHPGPSLRLRRPQKGDGSGGQSEQALGRSRGGFGTKVHGAISGLGPPVRLILTPGQAADVSHAGALIEGLPIEAVIADKGYDSKAVVGAIEGRGGEAVIPSLKNRAQPRAIDRERYKDRNLAERFWSKVKQHRRVATRYDKTDRNFLSFVLLASILVLLQ